MKHIILLIALILQPLFVFAGSSSSIQNLDLKELQKKLQSTLTAQGISKTELDQKMREISKNISPNQLKAPRLEQSLSGLPESDLKELNAFVKRTLQDHGITQADLDQLTRDMQNTIHTLQSN